MLIGVIAFVLISQLGGNGGSTVAVQNVVGQDVATATAKLKAQGFEVATERRPNDQFARGLVVRQNPAAGAKVEKGDSILLTVSDGVGTVTVPDVSGDSFDDAQTKLQDKQFKVTRQDEASDTVDQGLVTRTSPPAGDRADRGSSVTVFVSAGPAPVLVPSVVGQDQVAATQALSQAGFDVQKTNQPSNSVDSGNVISTNPSAGTPAARGSKVTIFVSTGPEQATVPDVVGDTQSTATNALTGAGFNVTVVQVPSTPSNAGKVIAQNPTAGTKGNKGDTVVITVGSGPTTSTST